MKSSFTLSPKLLGGNDRGGGGVPSNRQTFMLPFFQ
jgi:hypothetical protein